MQNLNGYDAPWPAGGGANKWDEEWLVGYISNVDGVIHESSGQTRIVSKNKIPVQPSTEYYIAGTASVTVYGYAEDESYVSSLTVSSRKFTTPANVYYVCFETSSAYGNTYNHDIAINYPSSVTTYSPYSNLCPISGWDTLTVEQRGEILAELTSSASASGVTCTTNSDGSVTVKGTCTANVSLDFFRNSSVFPTGISAGGKYVVSIENPIDSFEVLSYKGMSASTLVTFSNADHAEFTVPSDATGLLVRILAKAGVTYDTTLHVRFCPYDGYRSISIPLGQTVYSGYVDVVTGVGEITWAVEDVKNLTFYRYKRVDGTTWYFSCQRSGMYCGYDVSEYSKALANEKSNILKTGNPYTDTSACFWAYQQNKYFFIRIGVPNIEEESDFNAWLQSQTAVQIAYPLATPIPIQLTPQEVESLAGDNTMWSDANGDLTVEYRSN